MPAHRLLIYLWTFRPLIQNKSQGLPWKYNVFHNNKYILVRVTAELNTLHKLTRRSPMCFICHFEVSKRRRRAVVASPLSSHWRVVPWLLVVHSYRSFIFRALLTNAPKLFSLVSPCLPRVLCLAGRAHKRSLGQLTAT